MTNSDAYLIRLNLPRWMKMILVIWSDLIVCIFSVWIAYGLRIENWGLPSGNQLYFLVSTCIILITTFISFGMYRAIFRYIGVEASLLLNRSFILYTLIIFLIFTLYGVDGVPRAMGLLQPALLFICIRMHRYSAHFILNKLEPISQKIIDAQFKILIYGAGYEGRQLSAALSKNPKMIIKGFIDSNPGLQGGTIDGAKVYSEDKLKELINQLEITDVLFAIPSIKSDERKKIIELLGGSKVRVRTVPNLLDVVSGKERVVDVNNLDLNNLLGRDEVVPDEILLKNNIHGKIILVTGAGGSIGSELCRQIIKYCPKELILIDVNEYNIYLLYEELMHALEISNNKKDINLKNYFEVSSIKIFPYLASVRDPNIIRNIVGCHLPDVIYHAAAYKHVPLVEKNYNEGIRNNVYGTLNCAQIAMEIGVSKFVLVSTDKAVRPTSIMGASKRIAELVLQAHSKIANSKGCKTKFSMVRFGNVLGSSGSVIPLFESQIKAGGPITLTHKEITRYFMSITEAAQLVIQSCAMSTGGEVFLLDMGAPVRIYDLATKMIYLSGFLLKDELHPQGDIEIEIVGMRDGEKLYEELLIGDNPSPTEHPKIMKASEKFLPWEELQCELAILDNVLNVGDISGVKEILKKLVHGYNPHISSGLKL